MLDALLAVSAVTPSLLLLVYIQTRDLFPEPRRVVWNTFALGVLTVVPVVIVGFSLLDIVRQLEPIALQGFAHAFAIAAIPEEVCKFAVLYAYCFRHRAFDEPMDGVVYGVTVSLGFATLENVLYVVGGGFSVALSRALTALPCHALLGVIMGYYVGQQYSRDQVPERSTPLPLLKALFWPILLHGLYDFPLMQAQLTHQAEGKVTGFALSALGLIPLVLGALFIASFAILRHLGAAQQQRIPHVSPPTLRRELPTILGALLASASGTLLLGVALAASKAGSYDPGPNWNSKFWLWNCALALVVGPLGGWIFLRGIRKANR